MNVLRNQWSVSGQTVAVVQLSGSDEMGRVVRGVGSSRPGYQSCSLYAPTPLSCRRCVGVLDIGDNRNKSRLGVIQGHWKLNYSLDCIRVSIGVILRDEARYWPKIEIYTLHPTPVGPAPSTP